MSTWTNVADTVLEPGDPIRSVDIIAIKNNIVAVAGGAAGAPRVVTAALATNEQMNTANVLAATAGATAGAVGTYAFLASWTNMVNLDAGGTRAGSELKYAAVSGIGTTALSGTWRLMGRITTNSAQASTSLWLRIS